MKKALFLDRDGTINKMIKKHSRHYGKIIDDTPFNTREVLFNEGVKELVDSAKEKGYKIIIITNQPSVIRGDLSLKDYEDITKKICEFLGLERSAVFECFHREGYSMECNCRKPAPGLLFMAKGVHGIDLKNSIMVGDSWRDIVAGKSAGVNKTVFLRRKQNKYQLGNLESEQKMEKEGIKPDQKIDSLSELLDLL